MFGFTYDTWRETCKMYFKLGDGSKKAYLQCNGIKLKKSNAIW